MYAIIRDGAHSHRVEQDQVLEVAYRSELKQGDAVEFGEVSLLNTDTDIKVGTPYVAAAKVTAEVIDHVKGNKVVAFKFRRRKSSKTKRGHRQNYTKVRIKSIEG